MAGNGYDNGRGAAPRQNGGPAPHEYGGGRGTPPAPPAGVFGSYRGEQDTAGGPEYFGGHGGGQDGPQYFGDDGGLRDPRPGPAGPGAHDPYAAYDDNPGHTQAFGVQDPYRDAYGAPGAQDQDHVAVYRARGQAGPHTAGPRLHWRDLLSGMYLNPSRTFEQMRTHQVWLPALTVSLVYGALAVLGFGDARSQVLDSTFSVALWTLLGGALGFTVAGATLGAVTHALARQLGGDGMWQPTVGLSALVAWTTDTPRLLLALFLPADNGVVQVLGWASWLLCAGLMTTMVRRVHDLPWGKAAGAAALQLVALLILIKLPTLN
ncbi:YIP1 family protein [Streptacidiphilus sp. ASG 303]|uniref:Yip1 family protein n=1 Tax=Streptacidiphilus sp. ASG 303 TaxID=2896847 RepID=UPI001E525498|nr:Yip1 family protein [Streptacidiphilus sp. ASG 303]MCD0485357.1 YIP1 family protein [Streptacidiphilus sp. ASG 303]